tara:strand:- start:91 stop:990 length:900 start_codon:yes stop_codon:yes gene_type:complete
MVITVLVTWFIISRVGLDTAVLRELNTDLLIPNFALFVASSLLLMIGYAISAANWAYIVNDLGGPQIPKVDAIRLFMIANLGRYIPGKIWQIAGLAALAKDRGVAPGTAVGAAVLGQGIALVVAAGLGIGVYDTILPPGYFSLISIALIGSVIVLATIPVSFKAGAKLWLSFRGSQTIETPNPTSGLRWLLLYLVNWIVYALAFWMMVVSFDSDISLIPVAAAFPAAYVLGYLMIFAPAGLGVREGFLIVFLSPHLGLGPSGVIAVVARLWTTLTEVVPASVFWFQHITSKRAGEELVQ